MITDNDYNLTNFVNNDSYVGILYSRQYTDFRPVFTRASKH